MPNLRRGHYDLAMDVPARHRLRVACDDLATTSALPSRGMRITPGGQVFYVDTNVVNGVPNDPGFLGDSGIPAAAGHYSEHPVPGVSGNIQARSGPRSSRCSMHGSLGCVRQPRTAGILGDLDAAGRRELGADQIPPKTGRPGLNTGIAPYASGRANCA